MEIKKVKGERKLAALVGADNDVTPSSRWLFLQSTEAEMGEKVSPDEGLCDAGHHEPPRELPA
jgi:hypothetical protein